MCGSGEPSIPIAFNRSSTEKTLLPPTLHSCGSSEFFFLGYTHFQTRSPLNNANSMSYNYKRERSKMYIAIETVPLHCLIFTFPMIPNPNPMGMRKILKQKREKSVVTRVGSLEKVRKKSYGNSMVKEKKAFMKSKKQLVVTWIKMRSRCDINIKFNTDACSKSWRI